MVGGNSRVITLQTVILDPSSPELSSAYLAAVLAFVERLGLGFLVDPLVEWWNPGPEGKPKIGAAVTVNYGDSRLTKFKTFTTGFILVRVLDQAIPEDQLAEEAGPLRELVREYNESLTQQVSPASLWVSLSNKLDEDTLAAIATLVPPGETFNAYLARTNSRQLIDQLRLVGIINRRNETTYLGSSGLLNEDGKAFLARILIGKAIADPVLIAELPLSLRSSLAAAIPFVIRAGAPLDEGGGGPPWNLIERETADGQIRPLELAARALVSMRQTGAQTVEEFFAQHDLDRQIPEDPFVVALLSILLERSGKTQLQRGFRVYAQAADSPGATVPDMFGVVLDPVQTLRESFNL